MAYRIALTGGIGTGKTYLSKHFVEMGIPVFCADDEAKTLFRDAEFIKALVHTFGNGILGQNGFPDSIQLSKIVFSNENNLLKINRLVHPRVMNMFEVWTNRQKTTSVMMESAIVFEGNLESCFDKIIVADAPLELRFRRIMARNPQWTRDDILLRMSRQLPQEEKCRRADLVICTGETYREGEQTRL